MKTLIVFTSKHGTTEKIVSYMANALEADTINLLHGFPTDVEGYDRIIIGGSIYYKAINPKITDFVEQFKDTLLTKKVALFLVCMMSEESAAEQFNVNYDEDLLSISVADGFFGGILEKQELNPLEKMVTSFVFRNLNTFDGVYYDEVDRFIEAVK